MNFDEIFYYDETSPSCLRWKIDRYGGRDYKIKKVSAGDIAGSVCEGNEYYRLTYQCKQLKVHKIIVSLFNMEVPEDCDIDHVDGNPLNNKIGNLRVVSHRKNMRNQGMRTTNTSGVTGVHPRFKDGYQVAWVADIRTDNGRKTRNFSTNKYSNAFELACECRDKFLESIPEYSDRHGT